MDYPYHSQYDPEDRVYETGRTRPRKTHGGMIALLLVLVIFLSGIVCLLGILNFRMVRKLQTQETVQENSISFSARAEVAENQTLEESTPLEEATPSNFSLDIQQTPVATQEYGEDGTMTWQQVYQKNLPSVVSISCTLSGGTASGTGVVFCEEGYIVTNCHVVEDARSITVLLSDDRSYTARLIGADSVSDLAVLYIPAEDLTAAEFGDSSALQVGDAVVAIGDPLGVELRGTMTDGIISAINRDITVEGRVMTLIQTNAALNSGNSGGPLINQYGQVIGINTMKISAFTDESGVEGLGFAIPSVTVKEIVEQLIEQGFVSGRPTLGLSCEMLSNTYRHYYRLPEGLYINSVEAGSPAGNVGISAGDILISIDGTATTDLDTYNSILYSHDVGDQVVLVIYRGGRQYSVSLTLAENQG